MEDCIVASNLSRAFTVGDNEQFYALSNVTLNIKYGTVNILRGRSGSGKTTLLNILSALDLPTEGNVTFMGQDITKLSESEREYIRKTKMGFVFQSVSLIPIMTAYENVEFALRLAGYEGDRRARAEDCLKMVGLAGRMHHMPQEMSGGEQQRVAVARAIAHHPEVIFADEPTAELDTNTSHHVMKLFLELSEKENITIVMTTHDRSLMNLGTAVFELSDGKLVEE